MDCIFCAIIKKQIPADVVFENDRIAAFRDTNPQAPVHILIVPKKHITSLDTIDDADQAVLGEIQIVARDIARRERIAEIGYRLVVNCGIAAGQTVRHVHYHLLGGRKLLWPPG
ncbi:MAG: histidine triad nucleotide-binding protein [Elusimicrobia bacterium]|nr:histidine triad nucleotide-binding protein [Elusimicrobiota bacterium]